MTLEELLQQSIDLNNEKLEIEKRRLELANKTFELNRLIQEEKLKLELQKPQAIIIEDVNNGQVVIETKGVPRIDVLNLLRSTVSRQYNHFTQKNTIDIKYWEDFKRNLEKLPNIEIMYNGENKEKLEKYFTEPLWSIKKTDKFLIIDRADRNLDQTSMTKIPSAMYNAQIKKTTVPLSEGWRVLQVLGEPSETVKYDSDSLILIHSQIEQRKKMDEVALAKNADIPNPFTQINPETNKIYELKDFQKAGVFFIMTALGLEIPKAKEITW